ncbi:MAG: cytochrome c biogenesis protein CcdA [Anaerolineales bacterium]
MTVEPTIGLALLAGFVSFISPCVLPLVPAYVGYMSGHATNAAGDTSRNKFGTFMHGVFFVLGFTIFFVGFGLLTAAAADFLTRAGIDIPTILTRLGGVAVILFGLYVMKLLDPVFMRLSRFTATLKENEAQAIALSLATSLVLLAYYFWVFDVFSEPTSVTIVLALVLFLLTLAIFRKPLQQATSVGDFWHRAVTWLQGALATDTRNLQMQRNMQGGGYFGSLGIGIVFAAGWTPCIGPIYGSVLALAAESAASGASLVPSAAMLTAYSLGLGIPFLVTAMALNQMTGLMAGLKRNMRKVEYASGTLLIFIGILILSGGLEEITRQFGTGEMGDLSIRMEACTAGVAEGRLTTGAYLGCITEGEPKLNDRTVFAATKPLQVADISDLSGADTLTSAASPGPIETDTERLFVVDPDFDAESVPMGLQVGDRAPDFQTETLAGEPVSLSDFAGDVVLVNFWATWCGPCRVEMPEFQSFYDEFNEQGFTVLAINNTVTDDVVSVREFVDELGLSFPIVMDPDGSINEDIYDVNQYPTSYLVDGHGIIVARHAGPLTGEQLLAMLDEIAPQS